MYYKNKRIKNLQDLKELIKKGGLLLKLRLVHLLNLCWIRAIISDSWLTGNTSSTFKKGERNKPSNYRGIDVFNSTYKLYSGILNNRLKSIIETLLMEEQIGFRIGRFCAENIYN